MAVDRGGIQVIARAADILRALRAGGHGMSLGQIADRVGLPRSTVQRIIGALETERLVSVAAGGNGIRLGPELYALADSARPPVIELVRPLLFSLSRHTRETVDLSTLRGGHLTFIDQIAGTQRLRAVSSVGDRFPLTSTANGKACLALLADEDVLRLARTEWQAEGRSRDMAAFFAAIGKVREAGYAVDRDEHTPGISAVGVAFRDWRGEVYAVSIPTPSTRFAESEAELVAAMLALKRDIALQFAD